MHNTGLNCNKSLFKNLKGKGVSGYIIWVLLQNGNEIIRKMSQKTTILILFIKTARKYCEQFQFNKSALFFRVTYAHKGITWKREPAMNQTVSSSSYSLLIPFALSRTSAYFTNTQCDIKPWIIAQILDMWGRQTTQWFHRSLFNS